MSKPRRAAPRPPKKLDPGEQRELVKMSELARRCDVPAATIKHYIREGLVPTPALRTSRNMAYYDARLVPRIRAIKAIQQKQFLPLRVIREALDEGATHADDLVAKCLERSLSRLASDDRRTRAQLLEGGMPPDQLAYFEGLGILTPSVGPDGEPIYAGDDLALLRTLGAARRAGISPEMLPHTILAPYVRAIAELVRVELELLQSGLVPRAGANLDDVVGHAAKLSEELILILRRKMLVPMLRRIGEGDPSSAATRRTAKTAAPGTTARPSERPRARS